VGERGFDRPHQKVHDLYVPSRARQSLAVQTRFSFFWPANKAKREFES
jgi:hypothetical protein